MITGQTNQSKNATVNALGGRKAGLYTWGDTTGTWGDALALWGGGIVAGTNQTRNNLAGASNQTKS